MWSLIHNYKSKEKLEELMALLITFSAAVEKDDLTQLDSIGGPGGFQDRMAALMKSNDDEVCGFAALVLAVCGDHKYASRIAALFEIKAGPRSNNEWRLVTSRGRAATALGVMGAKEYTPKLLSLLVSANDYDRSGAAIGLAYLGDKSHAKDIVKLITNKAHGRGDAQSAIHALLLLDVAGEYADDIAGILHDQIPGEAAETAAYALAKLGAKQHAKDIAKLLSSQFEKGYAAKALAIMGAAEYVINIIPLLGDENALSRASGALALGVLKATQHAVEVSKLLKDNEEFVRYYAAVALVLMDAREYADDVIPIIDRFQQAGGQLNEGDFDPIVRNEFHKIKARFEVSLATIKNRK